MGKIKIPKSAPSLDMTPMVDLAFLLVTFFMLTAKFRANENVEINPPSSHSEKILPENVMLVTVDTAGRVFFAVDGQDVRKNTLLKMGQKYKITFTAEDVKRFSVMASFGEPMDKLTEYIKANENGRGKLDRTTPGVPIDSINNQLGDWVAFSYNEKAILEQQNKVPAENRLRIAIKADGMTNYKVIKRVIQVFQDRNINRFNLITNLETEQVQ